ncbi:glutathione S-transferase family protein [Roseovarius indicus]|uniref:glutathione S-transferase family protein n=1 Tax=Roseovarius indicus TaxID=540747 RepID=UPI0007DA39C1|nr:glutathione S-transferase family protein [Roseovarius indicus]OAO00493.1 hypothetical protein A8B76_13645 [Roseovarius indicus]
MLTLLSFPGDDRHASFSPFCLKAMCLLGMSGQDWEPSFTTDPSKMPYGRLPVLKTAEALIPDSGRIQVWLEGRGAGFDDALSEGEKAHSHALVRMVEEGLRYGLVHDRWVRDECWKVTRDQFFGALPVPLRGTIAGTARKRIRRMLDMQGTGQFSEADRLDRMARDLEAIRETLGNTDYLFGPAPSAADAAVVPVLDMIRTLPCDTELRALVRDDERIGAYLDRASARLYPS